MKTPLLSHQKNVFVARDGKVIGEFPVMQLPSLLETGRIFQTDYCYDISQSEWITMAQFVEKTKFFKPRQETEAPPPPDNPVETVATQQRKQRFVVKATGWIMCLVMVAALGAAVVWIWMLDQRLDQSARDLADARDQLQKSKEQYERLSFSYREISDPGVIRGSLINRNEEGVRSAMPGMKVQLYPRDEIEAFLKKRYSDLPKDSSSMSPDDLLKHFLTDMPDPLTTTVTDASGRYEFKAPKPGEYIVYTSVTTTGQGSRVWFLAVDSSDPLNTPVDITDSNYVRDFIPDLMIADGR